MTADARRDPRVALCSVLITIVFFSGVAGAVVKRQDTGPDHPGEWDPRVVDIAAEVEKLRELDFEHPVFVDFLTADQYAAVTRADETELTADDKKSFDHQASMFRALGIAEGELDLFGVSNDASDVGTLALYDPETERITVRGTKVDAGLEVTLAHELTHALQDQHFDLALLLEGREGQMTTFRALLEGDAVRIENLYVEEVFDEERREAYFTDRESGFAEAEEGLGGVPPAVLAFFDAPYVLGEPLVRLLDAEDGNEGVDAALTTPPPSEEALLDPVTFLEPDRAGPSGEDGPLEIVIPKKATLVNGGEFGVVSWYMVLAERIDPLDAFTAAQGWANDGYSFYDEGGDLCVRATFVGDDAGHAKEMQDALAAWAATLPAGLVILDEDGTDVEHGVGFTSCDPGADVKTGTTGRIRDAVPILPAVRTVFLADLVGLVRLDIDDATCAAHAIVEKTGFERITSQDETYFQSEEFGTLAQQTIRECTA